MWWCCIMMFILYLFDVHAVYIVSVYWCIYLYKPCMCTAGSTKSCINVTNSVTHLKLILWRTYFCGAQQPHAPQNIMFLWRTKPRCATEFFFKFQKKRAARSRSRSGRQNFFLIFFKEGGGGGGGRRRWWVEEEEEEAAGDGGGVARRSRLPE